ncbi:MAG: hypothetical protein ACLFN0_08285 [Thermovirgaceae bacterium]
MFHAWACFIPGRRMCEGYVHGIDLESFDADASHEAAFKIQVDASHPAVFVKSSIQNHLH